MVLSEGTVTKYRGALVRLLPRGAAWVVKVEGTLEKVLSGIAAEFAKLGDRVAQLLVEADPYQTNELLPDWERALSLPDVCTGPLPNAQLRRAAIVARLAQFGPTTPQDFEDLADSLGYEVTVENNQAWRVGISTCQDPMAEELWAHTFTVHAPPFSPVFAIAGEAVAEDPLMTWSNALLECAIDQATPAHASVHYVYDQIWGGYSPWGPWLTPGPAVIEGRVGSVGVTV